MNRRDISANGWRYIGEEGEPPFENGWGLAGWPRTSAPPKEITFTLPEGYRPGSRRNFHRPPSNWGLWLTGFTLVAAGLVWIWTR